MAETRWAFIHPFQLRMQRGIEVYLWNLASTLAKQGIQVDILTWDGSFEIPDFARVKGVRLLKVPVVRYYQAMFAVPFYVAWLLQGKYDHVFVHFAGYGEGPALHLARLVHSFPFSLVIHFPITNAPYRYRMFGKWHYQRNAKHLIGVSMSIAREVEQWAGRPCAVIGHGVNTQRFRPDTALRAQVRRELGLGSATPVLVTVAELEERKGIQFVLQALPKVLDKMPETRYLIIGDGPHRGKLEELSRNLHLQEHVFFLGFQGNVLPYLVASDIALLLSQGEASSISLLEYCAAGLPVITSNCPSFLESVHPSWGLTVPEQESGLVSQAIINLLSDTGLRSTKGEQARTWVLKNHNWVQIAGDYLNLVGYDE